MRRGLGRQRATGLHEVARRSHLAISDDRDAGNCRSGQTGCRPTRSGAQERPCADAFIGRPDIGLPAPHVPRDPLIQAIKNNSNAAVRLYAIDSLGMQGGTDLSKTLAPRRSAERNSDAKRHIGYALERKQQPADRGIIDSLIDWDNGQIDSAKIDKLAPDFRLATISGKNHRLSDYRGKKAVVLVFIYGDT